MAESEEAFRARIAGDVVRMRMRELAPVTALALGIYTEAMSAASHMQRAGWAGSDESWFVRLEFAGFYLHLANRLLRQVGIESDDRQAVMTRLSGLVVDSLFQGGATGDPAAIQEAKDEELATILGHDGEYAKIDSDLSSGRATPLIAHFALEVGRRHAGAALPSTEWLIGEAIAGIDHLNMGGIVTTLGHLPAGQRLGPNERERVPG